MTFEQSFDVTFEEQRETLSRRSESRVFTRGGGGGGKSRATSVTEGHVATPSEEEGPVTHPVWATHKNACLSSVSSPRKASAAPATSSLRLFRAIYVLKWRTGGITGIFILRELIFCLPQEHTPPCKTSNEISLNRFMTWLVCIPTVQFNVKYRFLFM